MSFSDHLRPLSLHPLSSHSLTPVPSPLLVTGRSVLEATRLNGRLGERLHLPPKLRYHWGMMVWGPRFIFPLSYEYHSMILYWLFHLFGTFQSSTSQNCLKAPFFILGRRWNSSWPYFANPNFVLIRNGSPFRHLRTLNGFSTAGVFCLLNNSTKMLCASTKGCQFSKMRLQGNRVWVSLGLCQTVKKRLYVMGTVLLANNHVTMNLTQADSCKHVSRRDGITITHLLSYNPNYWSAIRF